MRSRSGTTGRGIDFSRIGWAWALASLALIACAAGPEGPPPPPEPVPLAVGPAGSNAVVFQKVIFRIPAGTPLSVSRLRGRIIDEKNWDAPTRDTTAFNVTATDELRRLGYDVRDAADALFNPATTNEARYQMAAIVHALRLENDVVPDPGRREGGWVARSSEATMDVELQLYDAVARERVSTARVVGFAVDRTHPGAPMPKAFLVALRRALADPAFVAPLRRDAPRTQNGFPEKSLAIPRCTTGELALPDDLARAQEAVVVVVVGSGSGTGTIVSADGWVLTAAHVVGSQAQAVLRFDSGFELPAEVARVEPTRDAALLKVPGRGHPCLGTEDAPVEVGTEIWAIGNPVAEELARSVTRGVASGNRTIRDRAFLQTDAAVNPGNSGGPLLDGRGRLRGIVVEKIKETGIEGLGFAVPVADAERALGIAWSEPTSPEPPSPARHVAGRKTREGGTEAEVGSDAPNAPGGAPPGPR
ncbi:MAG: S1C family serine protease [Myxococcota bacterium]